ncbi:MAG: PadR family transcriptional regulator [Nocardioidaceae bacterium]
MKGEHHYHGSSGHHPHGGPWGAGPRPWVQALFNRPGGFSGGFGPGGFGPPGFGRGPKVRRGDVRAAILDVLAVAPMNGYQLIQQIAERTGGQWKPSPGSVYPTLQQLEDEALIHTTHDDGKKAWTLTDEGRAYVGDHGEEMAATWRAFDEAEEEDETPDLRGTISHVAAAVWQVAVSGSPEQKEEARQILAETRRRLYGLLAEGDEP